MVPWVFLAVSAWGALFTWVAMRPPRRPRWACVAVFFAGWLTGELALHHVAWQALATLGFVWAGALRAWPGWLGLAITIASWAGLFASLRTARRANEVVERSLVEVLGPDYASRVHPEVAQRHAAPPAPPIQRWNPFRFQDAEVRVVSDIAYAPEHGRRGLLDVYAPRSGGDGAPVLFQIHGGGWMIGDKRQQALPLMLHLARRGWVCVSANYRLSPKATFPDHIVDCKRALRWIRDHVAEYGGDPGFVVATGGSAGGHLSSLLALSANDPAFQPGFESADTRVEGCVPFYGVYDFTNAWKTQPDDGIHQVLERYIMKRPIATHRKDYEQASPMHRIHAGAPPFLVVHGTHDSLAPVEEARVFVELLRKTSRSAVGYVELPAAQHAFEVFHSPRTSHVIRAVDRFLASVYSRYLGGEARLS
jgi:acetyl esterase/lipase